MEYSIVEHADASAVQSHNAMGISAEFWKSSVSGGLIYYTDDLRV